jgi:hypothetical protein
VQTFADVRNAHAKNRGRVCGLEASGYNPQNGSKCIRVPLHTGRHAMRCQPKHSSAHRKQPHTSESKRSSNVDETINSCAFTSHHVSDCKDTKLSVAPTPTQPIEGNRENTGTANSMRTNNANDNVRVLYGDHGQHGHTRGAESW